MVINVLGYLHRLRRSIFMAEKFSFNLVRLYLYDLFVGKKFQLDFRKCP
jgi:hypothetical protein